MEGTAIGWTETSRVVAEENVAFCDLPDGLALLDLRRSQYYSLNPVAAIVWQSLREHGSVADIVLAVEAEFDSTGADVLADVIALLTDLERLHLVRQCND